MSSQDIIETNVNLMMMKCDVKPRHYRNKCELDDDEMCAMCGEYCAVKIAKGDF